MFSGHFRKHSPRDALPPSSGNQNILLSISALQRQSQVTLVYVNPLDDGSQTQNMLYKRVQRVHSSPFPFFICVALDFSDSPASELYLELLLLQVVVPALLEQGHTRQWLKNLVRAWCVGVSWLLDVRSYLLGDVPLEDQVRAQLTSYLPVVLCCPTQTFHQIC